MKENIELSKTPDINTNLNTYNNKKSTESMLNLQKTIILREITQKFDEKIDKKDKYVMASIDNIYMTLKTVPDHIKTTILILLFISFINEMITWNFRYILSGSRNYIYCYNTFSNAMELQSNTNICPDNKNQPYLLFIYDNDTNIANSSNFIAELSNINVKYLSFFSNISHSLYDKSFSQKNLNVENVYNFWGCVFVTGKEQGFMKIKYFKTCDSYTTATIFFCILFLGVLISNIILCFLADVYGRKKLLIFGMISVGLGCIGFGLTSFLIIKISEYDLKDYEYNNNTLYNDIDFEVLK